MYVTQLHIRTRTVCGTKLNKCGQKCARGWPVGTTGYKASLADKKLLLALELQLYVAHRCGRDKALHNSCRIHITGGHPEGTTAAAG